MKSIIINFTLISLVFAAEANERPNFVEPLQVITAWLEAQRDYENIPGISAGIVVEQKLIWSDGFGYSDLSFKAESTDSTIYSICSISKLFTSIAIMQLRDQDKLDLDDNISEHLPWFNIEQAHAKSAPVTIRSLLTHSSGLPRESDYPYWTDPKFPFPNQEQLRKKLSEQETLYPASTVYQYSNLGLSLLGEIVAEKSGVSYEKYVYDNILNPLRLVDTRPELPESLRRGQLATGYSVESRVGYREELAFFQARAIAAAAGFSSSIKDLAKFASWQFKTLEVIEDPILSGNTLREMQRVHWMDPDGEVTRGLGFVVGKLDDMTIVGHSGKCPGYLSQFRLIPKKKWAFIVMVNGLGVKTYQYVEGMYHILKSYEKDKIEEIAPEVNLEDYSGKYYSFWDGESIIVPWKGKLATFDLRSPDQKKPGMIMKHVEGDIFKRVRDDGNVGEEIRFERDKKDNVIRFWRHSQYVNKIDS
ncbi:MAG: serine hydrolase [Planctomycetota bacterium]|jgi:CubicO group peptidase (beta-lactamase class C family)